MTALQQDPIDHWLDLDVQTPREPLRAEMWDAFDQAANTSGVTRAYWIGVGTGYAVGFGLFTRAALTNARLAPHAHMHNPLDPAAFRDEEDAWAGGVLYGYKQATSERPDAAECTHCGQRILIDTDWHQSCHHGEFCDEHIADWHRGGGFSAADRCTYLDGE